MALTPLSKLMREAMADRGITSAHIALKLGVAPAAVSQWLSGRTTPRFERVVELADALGWDRVEFMHALDAQPNARIASPSPRMPVTTNLPRDVPVMGSAQGGSDGAFELNLEGGPVDFVRRPHGLAGIVGVFAIYIEGDSMAPWREAGDFAFVHPTRPPAIGDYVVVVTPPKEPGAPPLAWIKRLKRRTADRIITEQFNPPQEVTFDRTPQTRVMRVIDWKEALGM